MDVLSPADAASLTQHVARLLARHADPAAGAALHAAFLSDAPMFFVHPGRRAVTLATAGAIAPDTFAAAHERVVLERLRRGRMDASAPELTLASLQREPDGRTVAWFEATIAGHATWLAVGLQGPEAAPLVGWWTLWESRQDWSYAHGRLQTLVDYGFAEGRDDLLPRSWIDVALYRLFGHARPTLQTLPEARFGCHGDTTCCNIGFKIQVSPAAQAVVDAVPWETIHPPLAGVQLPVLPNGNLLVKDLNERCRFLDDHGRCRMHLASGRSVFTACTIYPFHFQATPDGVAVTATTTCPTVRGNLGPRLDERPADIHARLALLPPGPAPEAFYLAPGREVSWEVYRAAEAALIGFLGREDLPLRRRLWLGSLFLNATLAGWEFEEAAESLAPAPLAADQAAAREQVVSTFLDVADIPVPAGEAAPDAGEAQVGELRWMLENLLFSKLFGFKHDLRSAHHVNVLAYAMARHLQRRQPEGKLSSQELYSLTGFFWHQRLAEFVEKYPDMFDWLRAESFGGWMLAPDGA